ncbi:hypothetical protein [Inconstantimicrobium mannanitabidum]|uniref:Uncharacterized protein n=1 Tax=Inconstantimicrobium mannanitabidum TaxID=1604901 RepID=A0ACB5RCR9_9CLOT|nr:hypothetical protein [Clostridium sp. TW13]GKX66891.1 hypothetical protein rsdtw13_21490 [Clostridium sp. TW13]
MYSTTVNGKEFTIIFRDKITLFDKLKVLVSKSKLLIIEVKDRKKEFKIKDKNELRLIVDKYVGFYNKSMIITFDDLLKFNEEMDIEKNINTSKFDIKDFIETYDKSQFIAFMIPIIAIVISYFFFQLGYCFWYGFYLGGDLNDYISLIDIFMNPVPFNFKSITIIGVIYLVSLIAYFTPLIASINETKIINKLKYIGICLFIISMLFILCDVLFWGLPDDALNKGGNLIILFLMVTTTILIAALIIKACFHNILMFFSGISYTFIFICLIAGIVKIDSKSYWYIILTIIGLIMIHFGISFKNPVVKKFNKFFKSQTISFLMEILLYLPFIFLLCIGSIKFFELKINRIVLALVTVGLSLIFIILKHEIKQRNLRRKKNKQKVNSPNNDASTSKKKEIVVTSGMLILSLICICVLMIWMTMYIGKTIRNFANIESKDKIIYNVVNDKLQPKVIFGNVVAQTDNVYFISKYPERKLVTIKADNLAIYPRDKFNIICNPRKFYSLKNSILKKYENDLKHSKISVEASKDTLGNPFEYILDIKSNNEIKFSLNYSLDNDGNVVKFKLGVTEIHNKSGIVNDDCVDKLIDELMTMTTNTYNIPALAVESKFYFLNGYLEYVGNKQESDGFYGYEFHKE